MREGHLNFRSAPVYILATIRDCLPLCRGKGILVQTEPFFFHSELIGPSQSAHAARIGRFALLFVAALVHFTLHWLPLCPLFACL